MPRGRPRKPTGETITVGRVSELPHKHYNFRHVAADYPNLHVVRARRGVQGHHGGDQVEDYQADGFDILIDGSRGEEKARMTGGKGWVVLGMDKALWESLDAKTRSFYNQHKYSQMNMAGKAEGRFSVMSDVEETSDTPIIGQIAAPEE